MKHDILACNANGVPHDWLRWQDAVTLKVKGAVAYEMGEGGILIRGGISRMTGKRSKVDIQPIIFLSGVYARADRIPLNNDNLFRRDLNRCAYCGKVFRTDKLTRDHVIPTSRKGKNVWKNVVTACSGCNNLKDDMTPEEADMPLLYQPYAPNKTEELVMRKPNMLEVQYEYLYPYLPEHSRLKETA